MGRKRSRNKSRQLCTTTPLPQQPTSGLVTLIDSLRAAGMPLGTELGQRSGHWVKDDTIIEILEFVATSACPTFQQEQYDVRVCYIDSYSNGVDMPDPDSEDLPDKIILMLVIHTVSETEGTHFSSIIINPRLKLVHAFDTLGRWPTPRIKYTITAQFPSMKLLKHGYQVRNHTGKARQSGATCGPFSLWIFIAYAFNYKDFRTASDELDCCCLTQSDALGFWRAFTI